MEVMFYTNDERIAGVEIRSVQDSFSVLVVLLEKLGLQKNAAKESCSAPQGTCGFICRTPPTG